MQLARHDHPDLRHTRAPRGAPPGYKAPVRADLRLLGDLDGRAGARGGRALARALAVTRIARLTGLDRTGVEVASAVRPGGHVLQVTNGKGAGFAAAARGALLEAAELWAAERVGPVADHGASASEVGARFAPGVLVLSHDELAGPEVGLAGSTRCAWLHARTLLGGRPALVPHDAVQCTPAGGPLRPAWYRWTSNGMGAHPRRPAALLHALLEAVERDRLARALPEGFTEEEVAARLVDPATLAASAPRTAALRATLVERGFRVHLLDVSTPTRALLRPRGRPRRPPRSGRAASSHSPDLALPVAAAILLDEEGGPVPVAAGYACRLSRDGALLAALLEAAQSRATEIHGAREDVAFGDRDAARPLVALLESARPRRSAGALPEVRAPSPEAAVRRVVRRLGRAGFDRAVAVDLAAPGGLAVVKVLVPGFLLSPLLL
jgi:ribosomal protein S12 methylthiotransferase accessory factor